MICGAEDILVKDYVEIIANRMEADQRLVVASGRVEGEPYVARAMFIFLSDCYFHGTQRMFLLFCIISYYS